MDLNIIDKEKIEKELNVLLLKKRIFLIVGIVLFVASLILSIIFAVMTVNKTISDNASVALSVASDICFCAAVVIFVLRSALYSFKVNVRRAILNGQVQISEVQQLDPSSVTTVEVKDIPTPVVKTREQELVDQYEDLYKKGYITLEDFEAKKKEILGQK